MDVIKRLSNIDKEKIATEATIKYKEENSLSIEAGHNFYKFLEMLAWMEWCGSVGHSSDFDVFVDGDGAAQFIMKFKNKELQKKYDEIKKEIGKKYEDRDPEGFYFD